MKLIKSLAIACFLTCVFPQTHANKISKQYPEAYAGLNPNSYHKIVLNNSKSAQLSFELGGITIPLKLNQAKSTGSANLSFTQTIPNGSISATKGENSLFGQMHLNNKHYILTTNQAGIWAVELPQSGLSYNDCGMDHDHAKQQPLHLGESSNKTTKAAGTIIDVLVIYDQAIADRYPGSLLQTRVDQYFNVSNQAYANSSIDLAIRQVGLAQVGYDNNDANINLRNLIQQILNVGTGVLGLEGLPQLYADTGADLVIFLRTHNIETRGNCGIAYFPVQNNDGSFDASYGVNIMADGMSSWSICTDQLMVHEIGHNLSAGHHNWDPTGFGYPADARGFAKIGQFGTVMGSFGTGQPDRFFELDVFSNPAVQCGGGPCGVAGQANNANLINQFKGPISNYQASISSTPLPPDFIRIDLDQDGDGVSDWVDEFPFDSTETTDSDGDAVGDNADAFPNDASEQSDFDNDGIGDNEDFDDDNDNILDFDDAFPLDNTEVSDSDKDGIGDNADQLVFENSESKDYDNDGIGNHADTDDDNDGVIDLSTEKQDLLVISLGNNRILRFDAQTGLSKGIEVLPDDGLLTFQSDLAIDQRTQVLFYSTNSSIKTLDLMNRGDNPSLLIPAYASGQAQLGTGFPTAITTDDSTQTLAVAKLNRTHVDAYVYNNVTSPTQSFLGFLAGAETENIIDFYSTSDSIYALGQENRIYRTSTSSFQFSEDFQIIGNGITSWLVDPYAFVVTDDNTLIHSDQSRNMLVMTNGNDGSFEGIFADLTELGYSNPTGIDVSQDGRLLVAVADQNAILQFNLESQEYLGELVSGSGLDQPHKMVLVPQLVDRFNEDENKVLRPNAGNWYNPNNDGRGFNIGIFGNRIVVLWYTYDEQGLPIWYYSADFLNGTSYDTDLLKITQLADGTVSADNLGRITIDFDNEREASMTWQLGSDSGGEDIQWLAFSVDPEAEDYTGMWSRPDTPGWGMAVITNGQKTITIPFIYDGAGEPRWVISDVQDGLQPFDFNVFTVFSDTLCPTCSGPASTRAELSGTMSLNLGGDPDWSSAMLWADPIPGDWNLEQTELIRISSEPTRPR